MANNVRLDHGGIGSLLKSDAMRQLVQDAAEEVAENVRGLNIWVDGVPGKQELPVTVTPYERDRAAASVALAHPSGMAVQAKHGALSRAAAAAGLEVNG